MEVLRKEDIERALECISKIMDEEKNYLVSLDAEMGDGDLGLTMSNGFRAVLREINNIDSNDIGNIMMKLGMTMNKAVSSTMGTLVSICFLKSATVAKSKLEITLEDVKNMGRAALNGVMERGGAKLGDKTMIDVLIPAIEALEESSKENTTIKEAFKRAYDAAVQGMENTKKLKSIHGRAAYYSEKTVGKVDPGSVAFTFIFKGLLESVK